jgi:hypothetical protein
MLLTGSDKALRFVSDNTVTECELVFQIHIALLCIIKNKEVKSLPWFCGCGRLRYRSQQKLLIQ